jgi:hypothetical protein
MGKTHFTRSGGQEFVDSFYRPFQPTGNVLYVHSSGTATGPGFSPETAYSTIDAAISACEADNDDVVLVLPDHTESVTGAAGIAQDVAGVRVVGLGVGRNRPRVTFTTAAAASWDVSAARCSIENLVLVNGIDSQTAMVNVSAADCVIKDCEIQTGDASTQAAIGVLTTAAANRLLVEKCFFHGTVDAGTANQIKIVGGDSAVIRDNILCGACATTGNVATNTTDATNLFIVGNQILNQTADGNNKAIVLTASTTGLISSNRMAIIDSTGPAPVTAAGAYVSGNYWTGAAGVTASTLM